MLTYPANSKLDILQQVSESISWEKTLSRPVRRKQADTDPKEIETDKTEEQDSSPKQRHHMGPYQQHQYHRKRRRASSPDGNQSLSNDAEWPDSHTQNNSYRGGRAGYNRGRGGWRNKNKRNRSGWNE